MATRLKGADLLHISKGHRETINHFRLGVHLSSISGLSIDELVEVVCKDRFGYARQTLACARWALNAPKPQYRVVLARAYYAMYHAGRAIVFYVERGDDHEAHLELPKHLPRDLPNRDQWENQLKNARLERNRADYDPYPKSDIAFRASAQTTFQAAENFLRAGKRYLVRKGCDL